MAIGNWREAVKKDYEEGMREMFIERAFKAAEEEIEELKAENEAYKVELFNQYYCEASQNGAGHQEANEYAHKRVNLINK